MAKSTASPNPADNKEPLLNILDNIDLHDFDEIAAFQKGGKIDAPEEEEEEEIVDDGKGKPAPGRKPVVEKAPPEIEITDDMLAEGLAKTAGKEFTKKDPPAAKPAPGARTTTKKEDEEEVIDNPNPDSPFSVHYDMMVESGEWDPIEGFDGTKAAYLKAKEFNNNRDIEEGINNFLEEAFKTNPDGAVAGRKLLNHLARGGRVSDFVTLQAPQELDFKALDSDDEKVAEAAAADILPRYYQSIGWSKKDIDKKMAQLERIGGEVDEAKLITEPFQNMIKAREQAVAQNLQKQKQAETQSRNTVNATLLEGIDKSKDYGLFQIGKTKKEKDEIKSYMFMETEAGQGSSFSQDLNKALHDPDFLLFAANVLKNNIHKADPATLKKKENGEGAIDALEERLSKSLLNKKLSDKSADTPFGQASKRSESKLEFNLDEAVVISN